MRLLVLLAALGQVTPPDGFLSTTPVSAAVVTPGAGAVTTDTSYFFDAVNGNDANFCTSAGAGACQTCQGALNKIPKRIVGANVTVTAAPGTYTGCAIDGFTFEPTASSGHGASLRLTSPLTTASFSGNMTGTVTSATTGNPVVTGVQMATVTVTGAGWTVNQLVGAFFTITAGPGAGETMVIQSNTATVVTLGGYYSQYNWSTPTGASSYAVQVPQSTFNTPITDAPALPGAYIPASASYACTIVSNIRDGAHQPALPLSPRPPATVMIDGFNFAAGCVKGGKVWHAAGVQYRWNQFSSLTGGAVVEVRNSHTFSMVSNYATQTAGQIFTAEIDTDGATAGEILQGNYVTGGLSMFGEDGSQNLGYSYGQTIFRANYATSMSGSIVAIAAPFDVAFVGEQYEGTTGGYCIKLGGILEGANGFGMANIFAGDFSNCALGGVAVIGHIGLAAASGGYISTTNGANNGGFGVAAYNGAHVTSGSGSSLAITGTSGNLTLDGTTAISYANLTANGLYSDPVRFSYFSSTDLPSVVTASFVGTGANTNMTINGGSVPHPATDTFQGVDPVGTVATGAVFSQKTLNVGETLQNANFVTTLAGTGAGTSQEVLSNTADGGVAVKVASCLMNCTAAAGTVTPCTNYDGGVLAAYPFISGSVVTWSGGTACTTDNAGTATAALSCP